MSSDTGTVPTRVTSSRFIGRSRELAELEAALADASAGRPSLAFIAGESGVGKTRLLKELERGALAADARVVSGDCVSLGEDELPTPPSSPPCDPSRATATPCSTSSARPRGPGSRAFSPSSAPATALPVMDRDAPAQARVFEALLDPPRPARPRRAGRCWPSRTSTGPTPRRAPSSPSWRAACAPSACWSSPPTAPTSCTAATRCARCWPSSSAAPRARRIELAPLTRDELAEQLADILGAAPDDAAASSACTRAARATRCSPRSCWPPGSTAAASCRRRCATR